MKKKTGIFIFLFFAAFLFANSENHKQIFYEFKSVHNIPPQHFAEQFIKDLQVAEDLDQIKWIFDGKKISSLDKTKFLDELKNSNLFNNRRLFEKYYDNKTFDTLDKLYEHLKNNDDWFDLIFKIK